MNISEFYGKVMLPSVEWEAVHACHDSLFLCTEKEYVVLEIVARACIWAHCNQVVLYVWSTWFIVSSQSLPCAVNVAHKIFQYDIPDTV
jgi:hypothetical protein